MFSYSVDVVTRDIYLHSDRAKDLMSFFFVQEILEESFDL